MIKEPREPREPSKAARDIKVIEGELQVALKREAANVIAIGGLLLEAKDQLDEHGDDWLPWLEANFGLSQRTAYNYISAARFASKFATVANLKLRPTVLYELGGHDGFPLDEIEAIFKVAETEWVNLERANAIITAMHKRRRGEEQLAATEERLRAGDEQLSVAKERLKEQLEEQARATEEADDILEGPPPELPPSEPSPSPGAAATNFALASFDEAVEKLLRLHTKALSNFDATKHTPDQIMAVIEFLQAVADQQKAMGPQRGDQELTKEQAETR